MLGVTPEAVEFDALACLEARTASLPQFRDLGPLDLVQLTKLRQSTETSTYHFVSGVNISSSAAAAAHLNTLTFSLGDGQLWYGSHRKWKIINGTYCSWNAFSKADLRVKATIPGTVEEYTMAENGTTSDKVDERFYLETYMSAIVRAMLFSDDDAYFVECSRRMNPFQSKQDVLQFFHAFEALFGMGTVLGTSPRYQQATLTCNRMVETFFLVCQVSQMWGEAEAAIERIAEKLPEVRELLVRIYLESKREIKAVKLLVELVKSNPRNCSLLVQEALICLEKKGMVGLAADCALRASTASPGQFAPWETLAKVYIEQDKFADALLALNARPMVSPKLIDSIKLPEPRKVHSPLPLDGQIKDIWDLNTSKVDPVDPSLMRLSGGSLRGGSKWTYQLITAIFAKVGWSELMKIRGEVFLMDGEQQRIAGEDQKPSQKRLCEQKLDILFMTLWEDARVHSHWQREAIHFESAQTPLKKSALEWEILGCVAQRLHYDDQAIQAFEQSMSIKFCHRVAWHMLDYYAPLDGSKIKDLSKTLKLVVQLYAWNHRWHCDFSPRLRTILNRIVATQGAAEVRLEVEAEFFQQGVIDIVQRELSNIADLAN